MRVLILIALFLSAAGLASAQAPRPIVIEACNDMPFAIGIAAAYRNMPSGDPVLRAWYEVPAHDCLEGGLGEMVGDHLYLAVVSGEWRWPRAGNVDRQFCTPEGSFFGRARPGDCLGDEQLTGFEQVPIHPFRSGWGRVEIRYACSDLAEADQALCEQTRPGRDGMAEPVRSLQVCNGWDEDAEIAVGASSDFVDFEVSGWQIIPAISCRTVWRGFPAGGEVWFATRAARDGHVPYADDGRLCVASATFSASGARGSLLNAGQCPADAPEAVHAQRVRFQEFVAQYQANVPRRDR